MCSRILGKKWKTFKRWKVKSFVIENNSSRLSARIFFDENFQKFKPRSRLRSFDTITNIYKEFRTRTEHEEKLTSRCERTARPWKPVSTTIIYTRARARIPHGFRYPNTVWLTRPIIRRRTKPGHTFALNGRRMWPRGFTSFTVSVGRSRHRCLLHARWIDSGAVVAQGPRASAIKFSRSARARVYKNPNRPRPNHHIHADVARVPSDRVP